MKRDKLKDAMARRSPLAQRESVDPVDLYAAAEPLEVIVDNRTSRQTGKETSRASDKTTSPHVDVVENQPSVLEETPRRRYTTYLKPETIKAIKWLAVDGERNDYEIVQEALDQYLRRARR
jgi:hypothetical protein